MLQTDKREATKAEVFVALDLGLMHAFGDGFCVDLPGR